MVHRENGNPMAPSAPISRRVRQDAATHNALLCNCLIFNQIMRLTII
jgi:hypothetical protein